MKIQSGKNPVKRSAAVQTAPPSASFSKLKPVLFVLFMIIMVGGVCELQVYFKSKTSTTAAEISRTKMEIKRTERELVNLRNLIAERTSWSYVRSQIIRYGIKLHRPEPGQTHRVERLSDSAVKLAAANMRAKALERAVALAASAPAPAAETVKAVKPVQTVRTVQVVKRVKPAPVVKRRSVISARRRVVSGRRDLQRYEFR